MEEEIAEWFAEQSNMASVPAVAEFLGVDVNYVRDWARDNDLPRVGVAFVFSAEHALELWAELEDDEESDDDDDDDDDDDLVCTACDSPVDSDAAFCSSCGAELDDDEDEEAALVLVYQRARLRSAVGRAPLWRIRSECLRQGVHMSVSGI